MQTGLDDCRKPGPMIAHGDHLPPAEPSPRHTQPMGGPRD